jgi:hypothetical protein
MTTYLTIAGFSRVLTRIELESILLARGIEDISGNKETLRRRLLKSLEKDAFVPGGPDGCPFDSRGKIVMELPREDLVKALGIRWHPRDMQSAATSEEEEEDEEVPLVLNRQTRGALKRGISGSVSRPASSVASEPVAVDAHAEQVELLTDAATASPVLPGPSARRPPVGESSTLADIERRLSVRLDNIVQSLESQWTGMLGRVAGVQAALVDVNARSEVKRQWPDKEFKNSRCQHEYDALIKIGRLIEEVLSNPALSEAQRRERLLAARRALVHRATTLEVAESEGWGVAEQIQADSKTIFSELEHEVKEARKKAAKSKRLAPPVLRMRTKRPEEADKPAVYPLQPKRVKFQGCFVCGGDHFARDCARSIKRPGSVDRSGSAPSSNS